MMLMILEFFFVELLQICPLILSFFTGFNGDTLILQASETAYHQLVNHGYLKYIPNGVVIIFGFGLAGLLHLYYKDKLHTSLRKSIEYVLFVQWTFHISVLNVVVAEPMHGVLRDVCCNIATVISQVRSPSVFS